MFSDVFFAFSNIFSENFFAFNNIFYEDFSAYQNVQMPARLSALFNPAGMLPGLCAVIHANQKQLALVIKPFQDFRILLLHNLRDGFLRALIPFQLDQQSRFL
uniref:Uncharacterized protein n=1 Tax=uncultured bacterium scaffold00090 TaxID=1132476 RepID=I6ZXI0_9BACT|nr:hypothetical protein [uncultured bacterium scaffold00090]